jgi:hypothetical protein
MLSVRASSFYFKAVQNMIRLDSKQYKNVIVALLQKPLGSMLKNFTSVLYICSKYARVFVPGKPCQPSLMFEGKAWSPR